jgi:hypothetical protein
MQVTLDPGFVTMHHAADLDSVRSHVAAAREWSLAVKSGRIGAVVSAELWEWIADQGLVPLAETLDQLFQAKHFVEASGHDVAVLLLGILERASFFEDDVIDKDATATCVISDALGDSCPCHPSTDEVALRAWTLSAGLAHGHRALTPRAMISARAARSDCLEGEYTFSELMFSDLSIVSAAAGSFDLVVVNSPAEMLAKISPIEIAKLAAMKLGRWEHAVAAAGLQYLGTKIDPDDVEIHSQWSLDAAAHDVINNSGRLKGVLRGAAEIVLNVRQDKTHELREDSGPGCPQQKIGDWSAWRHARGGGDRIHYWRGSGGKVELSTVDSHDNFTIPPPTSHA